MGDSLDYLEMMGQGDNPEGEGWHHYEETVPETTPYVWTNLDPPWDAIHTKLTHIGYLLNRIETHRMPPAMHPVYVELAELRAMLRMLYTQSHGGPA